MRTLLLAFGFGIVFASAANAQAPPAAKKPPAAPAKPAAAGPEDAIRLASKAYVAALNAGDYKAAAAFWTADGEFIDPNGNSHQARKSLSEELAKRAAAAGKPQLALAVKSVHMVTPDSAVEDGTIEFKPAGNKPPRRGNYSAVWVKQRNKWLLHSIRETTQAAGAHRHTLSELAWLVGRWVAKAEGDTVRIDCTWSPGKTYLLREITVEHDGKLRHSINQRIGLDPLSPKIKSWSFDADGSLAEAFWEKSGDNWQVHTRGATPGGKPTSADNVYTDIGPQSFALESGEAKVGDDNEAAFQVKFSRVTAGAAPSGGDSSTESRPADEEPARQKILKSPEWIETQRAFNEWLSVQQIYTPEEVKKIRAQLADKIAKMSAAQLGNFLEDAHEKLTVLLSKQADDARLWIAQRMAVEVNLTPDEIKKMRPDIVNMTAAQVEQRLQEIQQQRQQTQQTQAAFDKGRQTQVKNIEAAEKQAEQEREAALNRAYESMESAGGYYYGGGAVNNIGARPGWGRGFRY